jgi:hypothetical protein
MIAWPGLVPLTRRRCANALRVSFAWRFALVVESL